MTTQADRLVSLFNVVGYEIDVSIGEIYVAVFETYERRTNRDMQQSVGRVINVVHKKWKKDNVPLAIRPGKLKHTYRLVRP